MLLIVCNISGFTACITTFNKIVFKWTVDATRLVRFSDTYFLGWQLHDIFTEKIFHPVKLCSAQQWNTSHKAQFHVHQ